MKTTTNKNQEMKSSDIIGLKTLYISLLLFFALAAGNIFAQTVLHSSGSKHYILTGQHTEISTLDQTNFFEYFKKENLINNKAEEKNRLSFASVKKIDVAFNPFSLIALVDSFYFWKWDTLSNGWIFHGKQINSVYDANNNLTGTLFQKWNGNSWENLTQYALTFDVNNNQTSSLIQHWNGSAWENYSKDSLSYDANNNLTNLLYQTWNGSAWENFIKYSYSYDASNNLISRFGQNWYGSAWENNSKYSYSYDANNNLTGTLIQQWNGSAWKNYIKYSYTYDANNNQISSLSPIWNGSAWENNSQSNYTYDASNNQISRLEQHWYGSAWEIWFKNTYTYDANNNKTSGLSQIWNRSSWENTSQTNFTYDANNFRKSFVSKSFSGGIISLTDSAYYYFHVVTTGVNDLMSQNEGIIVYPNPFGNELKISRSGNSDGEVVLYDMLGKEILREKISNQETIINTEKLSSGFYLLKYSEGNKIKNTKLLKF